MCPQPGLDEMLDRFEAGWRGQGPPAIETTLAAWAPGDPADAQRGRLLAELVMIDLWYRWRAAARRLAAAKTRTPASPGAARTAPGDDFPAQPTLEDYARRLPGLGPLGRLPGELIREEYRARTCWGDRPDHERYFRRFPGRRAELESLLDEVDREHAAGTVPSLDASTSRAPPDPPPDRADSAPSETVPERIGKYRVIGRLGAGGQAEVYRAVHPTLDKEFVIKLGRTAAAFGPEEVDHLVAEGKLLAELDHPNMARVVDLDFHQGRPYLVMEYVRGRSLRDHARHQRYRPSQAAALVAQVADALAVAHAVGVVHLDVKPENILVDPAGRPRLIDFGLARIRNAWIDAAEDPTAVSGTVQYMPPEQAQGRTDALDQRSDVFALGAVLYFLLAGRAPFAHGDLLVSLELARRCEFDRSALRRPGIPPRLASICLKAMSAEPADRYPTADALADQLRRFVAAPRRVRRLALGGAVLAAILVLAVGILRRATLPPPRPSPAVVEESSRPDAPDALAEALLGRPPRQDFPLEVKILGRPAHFAQPIELVEGQPVWFQLHPDRDCYVGVWHLDGSGTVTQLFPNRYDQDHFVAAGTTRTIPGEADYKLSVTASRGREYLHVLASTEPWPPLMGEDFGPRVAFASEDDVRRWKARLRGMVLVPDGTRKVAEVLVPLDVRGAEIAPPDR